MRLVPVVVVGLCVCLLASILGCKPAKRPSGKPDPWDSLRVTGRLGEVVRERSPRPDWEEMRAEPEQLTFLWADYGEHTLIGLLVVAGTGEAVYTYLGGGGYLQRRCTIPKDALDALWKTIERSGFLDLERSYYAKDIVDGMALKIGIRGKGGQKLVYAYNYFPAPVREVTTVVIEEILGTLTPPPLDLNRVLTPDYHRWGWVPASSLKDVSLFSRLVARARTRRGAPERPPSGTARTALGPGGTFGLYWVETYAGQPRWVFDLPAGRAAGGTANLTYAAGQEAAFPVTASTADEAWKQARFDLDGQVCLELGKIFLSGGVGEAEQTVPGSAGTGPEVFAEFSSAGARQEIRCDASKPEVARIATFLREKVIAPHAEEMDQARTLSSAEAWTFLQLLKFSYP